MAGFVCDSGTCLAVVAVLVAGFGHHRIGDCRCRFDGRTSSLLQSEQAQPPFEVGKSPLLDSSMRVCTHVKNRHRTWGMFDADCAIDDI